jgi:D-tyrosyl-tRNA(Tyr) deacylase
MKVIIQRVSEAGVKIAGTTHAAIGKGMLMLLGIEINDEKTDADYLCRKITNLRIFPDENDVMNKSVKDIRGEMLIISQFTLYADTSKGNRPSYIKAARPDKAVPLYEYFIECLKKESALDIKTGIFGADMKVQLVNDGPVTIIIDSKE